MKNKSLFFALSVVFLTVTETALGASVCNPKVLEQFKKPIFLKNESKVLGRTIFTREEKIFNP